MPGHVWVMATTPTGVDWQRPAAVLAAAASGRVAVLVVGQSPPAQAPLMDHLLSYLEIGDGPTLAEAAGAVRVAASAHELTLVVGAAGLLIPGSAGWTLTDLASTLRAPMVLATGDGPEAADHTTLALAALDARKLSTAVVVVGESEVDGLPVTPAGRIPTDEVPDDFPAAARTWLDPVLHASGPPAEPAPTPPPVAARTTRGRRVVLLLAGAFVSMSLVACGLAFCDRTPVVEHQLIVRDPYTPPPVVTTPPRPTPAAGQVCPEFRGNTEPTALDAATTNRVNAAWKRIEDWLAANSPKDRKSLRAPASVEAIGELQMRMSVAFPPDLVASLRRHDGVDGMGFEFPYFFTPTPVEDIPAHWRSTCGALAGVDQPDPSVWWDPDYVPFASSGDGGSLFVDQRPRWGNGRLGEFFNEDGVTFEGWPPTVADLLEKTADSLETGRPFQNRYEPVIGADGTLEWKIL